MANDITVSGTDDPYTKGYYTPGVNSKNTLTIESFFKLLSAQLANQDMTNPMDNSEMMAQMTNMAMVQSITAMTTSIQNSTAVSTQTYAASMIGQEITVAIVDEESGKPTGVKYGIVASVDVTKRAKAALNSNMTPIPKSCLLSRQSIFQTLRNNTRSETAPVRWKRSDLIKANYQRTI